jgi:hypothetical protein
MTKRIHPLTRKCRAWRAALIQRLITEGQTCGHPAPWQLDCKQPTGHWHHITGSYQRIKFYEQQARVGNLQVLCIPCHQAKSRADARARAWTRANQQDAHVRAWGLKSLMELAGCYDQRKAAQAVSEETECDS